MNKKTLSQNLLNSNFNLTKYGNYEKLFDDLNINVIIYSNVFGKIKMIGIFYKFKNKLEEKFHDEVWDKSNNLIDNYNSSLKIGSLGFEYIEASILDHSVLNNINAGVISKYCSDFTNLIKPLLDEYNL